jgi:CTP synthase
MTVVLVTHRTEAPAVDGMIAAMVAAERDAPLVTAATGGAGLGRYDCMLHVLAHGELAPNGLFWTEWASGRLVEPPMQVTAIARHPAPVVVVPVNPFVPAQAKAAERIALHAEAAGRPVERLRVEEDGPAFRVFREDSAEPVSSWVRDGYGRPVPAGHAGAAPGQRVRILVVGDESLTRDTYPANLAALGDAADALGVDVDLAFRDPRDAEWAEVPAILPGIDGIVLPGGSDMEQVPGQIEIAQMALLRDTPTVGLCLGMQTMATAVARRDGRNDANMAEADPDAQTKTFVRLHDEAGRPEFRVGLRQMRVAPGSRLGEIFGGAAAVDVHCNHRYVFDPELQRTLDGGPLVVSGLQADRDLADAIEVPAMRFFVGLQGHPELMARRGTPHPLLLAFLREAAR